MRHHLVALAEIAFRLQPPSSAHPLKTVVAVICPTQSVRIELRSLQKAKSPHRSVWILSSLTTKDFGALPRVGQESYVLHYIMHNHFKSGAGRENSDFTSLMYVITSLPCFLAMCLFNGQSFPPRNLSSYPYAKFYVTSRPQGRQDESYSKCPISLVMDEEARY